LSESPATGRRRSRGQKAKDFVTFPLRAVTLFDDPRWGLSDLAAERFDYVSGEVTGYCLDVGCGRRNRLINEYLDGNGKGVDVFRYEGLEDDQILEDPAHFPFEDSSFDSITFIANINHVPEPLRDVELAEACRCLRPRGTIVMTMGNPLAELLVHRVVAWHDRLFGTKHDMDSERGMIEGEEYFLRDAEIRQRLLRAGFAGIRKKRFATQWGLNHLFVATKPGLDAHGTS
jgi:SAM-dependent methyltransferase